MKPTPKALIWPNSREYYISFHQDIARRSRIQLSPTGSDPVQVVCPLSGVFSRKTLMGKQLLPRRDSRPDDCVLRGRPVPLPWHAMIERAMSSADDVVRGITRETFFSFFLFVFFSFFFSPPFFFFFSPLPPFFSSSFLSFFYFTLFLFFSKEWTVKWDMGRHRKAIFDVGSSLRLVNESRTTASNRPT